MHSREWGSSRFHTAEHRELPLGHNGPIEKSYAKYGLGFEKGQPKVNPTSTP